MTNSMSLALTYVTYVISYPCATGNFEFRVK